MSICWHDTNGWRDPCYAGCNYDRHNGDAAFTYGRCRSGRRWFWAADEATGLRDAPELHGHADTEDGAPAAARAARRRTPRRNVPAAQDRDVAAQGRQRRPAQRAPAI